MNKVSLLTPEAEKYWYVIYTRPKWEKKVAELLTKTGVENYCPLNKVTRQWSDRAKVVLEPLFTSYVFVRVSESEKWQVRDLPGVINYIYWLGRPAVVPGTDIEAIKSFLNEHEKVFLERSVVKAGDRIMVTRGAFLNVEGTVVAMHGKKVKIHIPSIGVALVAIVALEADSVRVMAS